MEKTFFDWFTQILGLASDTLALLGIGGLLTWSVFKGRETPLAAKVLSVSGYSVKTGLCMILALLCLLGGMMFTETIKTFLFDMIISFLPDQPYEQFSTLGYVVSGTISALLLIPAFLYLCVRIYRFSGRETEDREEAD